MGRLEGAPEGGRLQTCSIIPTDANELMARVDTRMPVIIHTKGNRHWLERESVLRPYEADAMAAAPCSPKVGNVRNNGMENLGLPHKKATSSIVS